MHAAAEGNAPVVPIAGDRFDVRTGLNRHSKALRVKPEVLDEVIT